MYKKISSTIFFLLCLLAFSSVQAGPFSFLNPVYQLLLRSSSVSNLNVEKSGNGTGIVTSDTAINCGTECNEDFEKITDITLTATAATGSLFTGWSGGECAGNATTCTVQVDKTSAITVTAEFTLLPALTVSLSGSGNGTVTSAPGGIDCGLDCEETYQDFTTSVTLTANAPDTNSYFAGWSGNGCSGTDPACTITMGSSVSVIAEFTLTKDLTVIVAEGGSVTSSPSGVLCPGDCTESFDVNTSVTLTAEPDTDYIFTSWSASNCPGNDTTCYVSMDVNKTITANFIKPNLTRDTAYVLAPDTPIKQTIDLVNDKNWYSFVAGGQGTVTVAFDFPNSANGTEKDWHVQLFADNDPDAPDLELRNVAVNKGDSFDVDLPAAGTYYFVVSKDEEESTIDYSLTIVASTAPAETELGNDTLAGADSLAFNTAIHGNMITFDDQDWFEVSTGDDPVTATLAFAAPGTEKEWIVSVYPEGGDIEQALARTAVMNGSECLVGLAASSTYYFVVSDLTSDSTAFSGRPYTLIVRDNAGLTVPVPETERNNELATASPIDFAANDSLTGQSELSIDPVTDNHLADDIDWFSFSAIADTPIIFIFSTPESNIPWKITVHNEAGTEISTFWGFDGSEKSVTIPSTGTYYLVVTPVKTWIGATSVANSSKYTITRQ